MTGSVGDAVLRGREGTPIGGSAHFWSGRPGCDALALAAELEQVRVLYLDQLLDNLGSGTDDFKQKAVRDALQPLRALARELDLAAFGSLHPNKRGDTFRQLVSGAAAFNAVSRSSLLLAQHPDDEDRRVLVRGKGNLSAAPPAVEFSIVSHKFTAHGYDHDVPLATDFAESDLTVDDLIRPTPAVPPAGEARTIARDLVAEALADGDWHHAGPIIDACEGQGIPERVARRASGDLGVEKRRVGFPAQSSWRLPRSGQTSALAKAGRTVRTVRSAGPAPEASPDSKDRQDSTRTSVAADRTGSDDLQQQVRALSKLNDEDAEREWRRLEAVSS